MTHHNQEFLRHIALRHRVNQVGNLHHFYEHDCTVLSCLLQANLREEVTSGCILNVRRVWINNKT